MHTRGGSERWIVHELLHVQQQGEGREDPHHWDERWARVDALVESLR